MAYTAAHTATPGGQAGRQRVAAAGTSATAAAAAARGELAAAGGGELGAVDGSVSCGPAGAAGQETYVDPQTGSSAGCKWQSRLQHEIRRTTYLFWDQVHRSAPTVLIEMASRKYESCWMPCSATWANCADPSAGGLDWDSRTITPSSTKSTGGVDAALHEGCGGLVSRAYTAPPTVTFSADVPCVSRKLNRGRSRCATMLLHHCCCLLASTRPSTASSLLRCVLDAVPKEPSAV